MNVICSCFASTCPQGSHVPVWPLTWLSPAVAYPSADGREGGCHLASENRVSQSQRFRGTPNWISNRGLDSQNIYICIYKYMHICMCNCYGYTHVILYQYIGLYYNFHNATTDKVCSPVFFCSRMVKTWPKCWECSSYFELGPQPPPVRANQDAALEEISCWHLQEPPAAPVLYFWSLQKKYLIRQWDTCNNL